MSAYRPAASKPTGIKPQMRSQLNAAFIPRVDCMSLRYVGRQYPAK